MDPEDLHELACAFLHSGPPMGQQLHDALEDGNLVQLRFLAHRLAGTLGFFDEPSAAVARRLETALVRRTPTDLGAEVAALDRELRRVTAAVEARVRATVAAQETRR